MIGAGTFINPLLKVVTTVAILAAVGIFILKPVLDSGEEIARSQSERSQQLQRDIQERVRESLRGVPSAPSIDIEVPDAAAGAQKLSNCVNRAAPDAAKIQRCMQRFGAGP